MRTVRPRTWHDEKQPPSRHPSDSHMAKLTRQTARKEYPFRTIFFHSAPSQPLDSSLLSMAVVRSNDALQLPFWSNIHIHIHILSASHVPIRPSIIQNNVRSRPPSANFDVSSLSMHVTRNDPSQKNLQISPAICGAYRSLPSVPRASLALPVRISGISTTTTTTGTLSAEETI